jgi:serine/threonine protein kinase
LQEAANVAQNFSLEEIVSATNNFSTIVGRGGFGIVYKGILNNGAVLAVKVLSNTSQQGPQQFLNEVKILNDSSMIFTSSLVYCPIQHSRALYL